MNIEGLGPAVLRVLCDQGLITGIGDIYRLKDRRAELIGIERMGEKSVENLLNSIENTKKTSCTASFSAWGFGRWARPRQKYWQTISDPWMP